MGGGGRLGRLAAQAQVWVRSPGGRCVGVKNGIVESWGRKCVVFVLPEMMATSNSVDPAPQPEHSARFPRGQAQYVVGT